MEINYGLSIGGREIRVIGQWKAALADFFVEGSSRGLVSVSYLWIIV